VCASRGSLQVCTHIHRQTASLPDSPSSLHICDMHLGRPHMCVYNNGRASFCVCVCVCVLCVGLQEILVDCSGGDEVSLESGTTRKLEALDKELAMRGSDRAIVSWSDLMAGRHGLKELV
jgi:hypothetical protein